MSKFATLASVAALAAGTLLLLGSAWGEETKFRKAGASIAMEKRDSAQCWRLAQKAKLTEEQAAQNVVAGYLVGGIIGVMIVSSSNEDANKNPKSQFRRQVHADCMAKRGYKQAD
jgi:hypothetical protein